MPNYRTSDVSEAQNTTLQTYLITIVPQKSQHTDKANWSWIGGGRGGYNFASLVIWHIGNLPKRNKKWEGDRPEDFTYTTIY